jgi:reverse transcriptase-like protein
MLKLDEGLLELALNAVVNQGYGDFFPEPTELGIAMANWDELRPFLASLDLDTYTGYDRIDTFAPKSRLNIRRVALLHPFDLLLYTGLVLALRDDITHARLPQNADRVFSYRADGAALGLLYSDSPSYSDFKRAVKSRADLNPDGFVGITDIADFYPRIYQHRLVNALQAAAGLSKQDYIRALEKMLFRFSDGASYGIPIGPPASRPLAEAVLVDVDSTLMSYRIDFIRFTDDFVIFAATPEDAEYGIRILAETLFLNHGLTLQTAKTKVLTAKDYTENYLTSHTEKEEARRKLLEVVGEYDEAASYDDLDEDQKREVDKLNLSEMLEAALAEGQNVDFREVSFILGRLSALKKPELIPIVLDNLERLYPVAHSIAAFFKQFSALDTDSREKAAEALLAPILDIENAKPSDYYCIWILSLFHDHREWNHAQDLLRIFRSTNSDAVRRFAALALATSGTRSEAIQMPKYLASASSLSRTAILLATAKMGTDERKYLRQGQRLNDPLEKLCATS